MKINKINLLTDFSFIAFIFLLLGTVFFVALDPNHTNINVVVLSIVAMVMILTYFTNLAIGISAAVLLIIAGIGIMLYFGLEKGYPIPPLLYFWCIMILAFTVCIDHLSKNSTKLQKTVVKLEKNIADLVTIDDLTGLKNQKQFLSDTDAYMSIALRYKLKLALVVAELRYQDDIERVVGHQNMDEIIVHISQALSHSVRREDLVYIVDSERFCFAVLMITNDYDGINIAIDRTKKKISDISVDDIARAANVDINMRIGFATLQQEYATALDLLNAAKHELEFDV